MTGMDAILAAINDLKLSAANVNIMGSNTNNIKKNNENNSLNKKAKKPRAPWRTKLELERLYKEGVCTRCTKSGHIGPKCPFLRPARRPADVLTSVEEDATEDNSSLSGNEIP